MHKKLLISLLAASALAFSSAQAAVVFSDNFTDGTVDGWTGVSGASGTNGTLSIVDGTSLGLTGNSLNYVSNGAATQSGPAILLGSTYTLANTGDYIALSFDFVVDVLVTNTGMFRYGLWDDPDNAFTDANPNGEINGADGYFGQISSSATDRGRVVQSDSPYYPGAQGTNYELKELNNAGWLLAADTAYTATLTITKTALGATATVTFSGSGSSISATESELLGSPYLSFDTIAFGINATNATVLYDNVLLTSSIPEPSTYALLAGFMALGLVIYRRRVR